MKFRARIRRIEEKLSPATTANGKKLIPPLLVSVLVSAVVDLATGNRRPSTLEESEHAKVDGKVIDREPGESFEHFERRVKALLPPPQYSFAQEISFWGHAAKTLPQHRPQVVEKARRF
jgi:hypothetical protein